jgi:uncharacterized protein (DUF362 family)
VRATTASTPFGGLSYSSSGISYWAGFMNSSIGLREKESLLAVASCAVAAAAFLGCGSGGATADKPVVAVVQSSKANAADLSTADVADLVGNAVSQAGGLDFINDGQTVVLKPNLITLYQDAGMTDASVTVNGIATDWRVVKAVADLVRAKNPSGKILVMEGSRLLTSMVYVVLGYTSDNFGSSVDEFIVLEGSSCSDSSTADLEERAAPSGKQYWLNKRYVEADVVISIPTMATDAAAGIAGAVENLGIGATPAGQYGSGDNSVDCTRVKIDQSSPERIGEFIRDYYRLKPADFVVMDGLQGLEHGPLPVWDDSGTYEYESSIKNMRLILAGRNAIAVDTIEALVMRCDPKKVPYLTKLEADGLGTTDTAKITVVDKQPSEVAQPFAGKQTDICPGP